MDIGSQQHWKLTAIGMALVIVTAVATGLVVANWYGPDVPKTAETQPAASPELPPRTAMAPTTPAVAPSQPSTTQPAATGTPARAVTDACNQYAANHAPAAQTQKEKVVDVVKDAAVGAVGGAAVGALGGAIGGGGKGAGKGAAIGGILGGGAGTVYGIYENRKNDQAYRAAYSSCMKSRGYTS
jgi:hypothetical protein